MRVVFHCEAPFHIAMLGEAFELARSRGLDAVLTRGPEALLEAAPRVVVHANQLHRDLRSRLGPEVRRVFTRHGFSSKNFLRQVLRQSDIVCLSSSAVEGELRARFPDLRFEAWVTGFTAVDALYRASREPPPSEVVNLLYAPTWTPGMAAPPVIGAHWVHGWLADPRHRVLVKFHPHVPILQRGWLEPFAKLKARYPGRLLLLHPDLNVYELMARSHVLLTDTSSVMFYWLALDRPVVLVDPRVPPGDERYDPDGPEWRWRDMGPRVRGSTELLPALAEALRDSPAYAARRAVYRDHVYGDSFDGRSAHRLVERLAALA